MLRLVVLFFIMWLAAVLLRKLIGRSPGVNNDTPARMVRCAHCGLFLPESETIVSSNHFYCCKQHESAARKK